MLSNKVAFCGDFAIANNGKFDSALPMESASPWQQLKNWLGEETVLVGNVECSITSRKKGLPFKWVNLKMPPTRASLLTGLDVAILGNNHIGDFGYAGCQDTLAALRQREIASVGVGDTLAQALSPAFVNLDAGRIGIVSLCCPTTNSEFVATHCSPGTSPLGMQTLKSAVQSARKECDAVIAFLHWGREQVHDPVPDQLRLARHAIDCGADAVIGCHSHTIQSFEKYKNAWIFYGLGNFFFDPGVAQHTREDGTIEQIRLTQEPRNRESLVVTFSLSSDESHPLMLDKLFPVRIGDNLQLVPIKLNELSINLAELNNRLAKFVKKNHAFLEDRSEPRFRSVLRNGVLAYWYEQEELLPQSRNLKFLATRFAKGSLRRIRPYLT